MSSTWGMTGVSDALPAQEQPTTDPRPQAGNDTQKEVAPVEGWNERQAMDYSSMTKESAGPSEGAAQIYQWDDEFGDVGPKHPELELQLFGEPESRRDRAGLDFSNINSIQVTQEGPVKIQAVRSFKEAGLHPVMVENIELSGYEAPTPIQKYTIPSLLQGYDVIGVAQTGSGKTAAYLLPILSKLMGKAKKWAAPRPNPARFREGIDEVKAEPLVLIVVPTRELAVQIFNEARKFCYRTMLRPCVVYGGIPIREQIGLLNRGCDLLIGTPGRLVDFIHRPQILTLRRLKFMVLDEADEMLDQGWEEDLRHILSGGEQDEGNIKFGLFSATFPKAARDLAREYLSANHVRFRVGRAGSTTANIKQVVMQVDRHEKRDYLLRALEEMAGIRTIVFANSRHEVDNLDDFLYNSGLPVTSIHRDRTQSEREYAMRAFRSGNAPILIATGVCARGIDVKNVQHVINYDLPSIDHGGIEEYTHRIGRTGRIGHRGVATSFYTDRDEGIASVLTRTLLETKQEVPDFLQEHIPEGECIKFETESDYDPNDLGGNMDAGEQQDHQMRSDSAVAWASGDTRDTNDSANAGGWTVASSTEAADPNPVAKSDVSNSDAWGATPSTNGFSQAPSNKVDGQLGPSTWGAGPVASGW